MPISLPHKFQISQHGLLYVSPTGSGKTRQAIDSTKDQDTTVVGTASLTKNFENEEQKAYGKVTPRHVTTYAALARTQTLPGGRNLVLDESQYIRNPQTKAYKKLWAEREKYDKALVMTATPIVNEPFDIVPQVNLAAGDHVLPTNKQKFYEKYYGEHKVDPGLLARVQGVQPGSVRFLRNPAGLKKQLDPYVMVEDKDKFQKFMPKRNEEVIKVPMDKHQQEIYSYIERKHVPYSLAYKIKKDMPPSKQEMQGLNTYLGGLRQVSNTTSPYSSTIHENPKIQKILGDLEEENKKGGKVLVYSNYLDAGVQEIKKSLDTKQIPYSQIIGSMSKPERARQVQSYNSNQTRTMLITGAGSEGLNLPKTTLVQLTEPHWNIARLYQASSRGIRRGDDPNREVKVKTYLSVFPEKEKKFLGVSLGKTHGQRSVDEYLYSLSKSKEREADTFLNALREKQGSKLIVPVQDVFRTTGSVTSVYEKPIKVNLQKLQKLEDLKLKSNKETSNFISHAGEQDFNISREHYKNELQRILESKKITQPRLPLSEKSQISRSEEAVTTSVPIDIPRSLGENLDNTKIPMSKSFKFSRIKKKAELTEHESNTGTKQYVENNVPPAVNDAIEHFQESIPGVSKKTPLYLRKKLK